MKTTKLQQARTKQITSEIQFEQEVIYKAKFKDGKTLSAPTKEKLERLIKAETTVIPQNLTLQFPQIISFDYNRNNNEDVSIHDVDTWIKNINNILPEDTQINFEYFEIDKSENESDDEEDWCEDEEEDDDDLEDNTAIVLWLGKIKPPSVEKMKKEFIQNPSLNTRIK